MKSFLNIVAEGYKKRYRDLSRLTFVMPNKRSGSFLLKAFADLSETPAIAPRILPINDFITKTASLIPDSRIDLIFRLYSAFLTLPGADTGMTFEKFSSWGEVILSDFNEIDLQMVDASEIFKNVYDLNALRSNFLTPEQKRVMVEYFNYSPALLEVEFKKFWQRFDSEGNKGAGKDGLRHKFLALWQLLLPLYEKFNAGLDADGLCTSGGAYRRAAERVEQGYEPFEGEKLVFVGFNALSEAENRLFSALKEMTVDGFEDSEEPKADFLWDLAPEVFMDSESPALKFVSTNSRADRFPVPEWIRMPLRGSIPAKAPEIKVVAVPSNVMQAKIAGMELQKLVPDEDAPKEERDKAFTDLREARIAVVLPDENLLLPVLYSLPKKISRPNLTMGFPLRQTPVISFASLLRKLQRGGRVEGNRTLFYYEDVKDLLAHPYSRVLFTRETIEKMLESLDKGRVIMVPSTSLLGLGGIAGSVFRVFGKDAGPSDVIAYMLDILSAVRDAMGDEKNGTYLRADVEKIYIGTYTDALIRLRNSIRDYGIHVTPADVFTLSDRLIAGESVVFDGRPLEGLQVMGVLETRCLDFDRIIMLNVNEKVMPRVGRNSTFIPNIVRSAFAMPPANYQEELFAYYFFRVLGRCRSAILTYDARSAENRSPGPSRYLLQLKYLVPDISVSEVEARFRLPRSLKGDVEVEKSEAVMDCLHRYYASGDFKDKSVKKFSASALNHYFSCPLKFLYCDVLGLRIPREQTETVDAIDLGTIVHRVIEHLYFPEGRRKRLLKRPILITPDFIRGLLNEKVAPGRETRLEKEAREAVLKVHFKDDDKKLAKGRLRGSAAIIFPYILDYVRNILRADLRQAPFRLWGSEIEEVLDYELSDGRKVALIMVIDRLDQEGAEGTGRPFRIVDYKSGAVHLTADSFDSIFDGTGKASNIFQLLLYAELLLLLIRRGEIALPGGIGPEEFEKNLKIAIYGIINLPKDEGIVSPVIHSQDPLGADTKWTIETIGKLREYESAEGLSVVQRLNTILEEILDASTPFRSSASEDRCSLCDYRLRCEVMRARREVSCPSPR